MREVTCRITDRQYPFGLQPGLPPDRNRFPETVEHQRSQESMQNKTDRKRRTYDREFIRKSGIAG